LGFELTATIVVAVGRLSSEKRHHILIDSMKHLSRGHLLIAGDGDERDALKARIAAAGLEERVRLLGNISPSEVDGLLAAGDVFAMSSQFEGLSLALVEAMTAGLPVVATDIPPIRDVVVDDQDRPAGVLMNSTDPERWAEAILKLIENPKLSAEYGERARVRARAFDIDRSAIEYVTIAESQLTHITRSSKLL
jgi:glycosyltransferase involved in cell wall biosynthesis